jgi:hypothetical protein
MTGVDYTAVGERARPDDSYGRTLGIHVHLTEVGSAEEKRPSQHGGLRRTDPPSLVID